jgi:hypothetical protein
MVTKLYDETIENISVHSNTHFRENRHRRLANNGYNLPFVRQGVEP